MSKSTRQLGYEGESLAEQYLKTHGYRILQKNFTVKGGEIDLIAKDGEYLVFVEVKSRSREDYGSVLERVDKKKQQRILYAAKVYLTRKGNLETLCRFDVVTILNQPDGSKNIELIRDAFQMAYRV